MRRHLMAVVIALASVPGCGGDGALVVPAPNPSPSPTLGLLPDQIIQALDYWQEAAGISYVLIESTDEPRILIRPGTDGLAPQGGGRALIDGTYSADNRARSGLVVFEPGGGQYCRSPGSCQYLHRHEIGHALGFIGHSVEGLMNAGPPALTDRERRMIVALYSLPHGASVEQDGRWSVAATGATGQLDDGQAALDIRAWNMNATGGASFRQLGVISRWELPVRVRIQP